MLKNLLRTAVLIFACSVFNSANAQKDTSYYDLGRIRIKKAFAQSVTIKGEDLEKFPATNLSDAIATWTVGTHLANYGAVYIIDGDLVSDVNAYSIFDVKSVTLIENATAMLNGVTQQQSLILITTRKGDGDESGFKVAGQTDLINARGTSFPSTSNASYYHQYYLSAFKTVGDMHFGASADYQHDASLAATAITTNTLANEFEKNDRLKLYGFFDTRIGGRSVLDLTINYVPQKDNEQLSLYGFLPNGNYTQTQNNTTKPSLLNTKLLLTSKLSTHINNELSFNYDEQVNNGDFNAATTQAATYKTTENLLLNTTYHDLLLRDNLAGRFTANDWTVEPMLNFSYRYTKNIQWSQVTYNNTSSGMGSIYQSPFYEQFKIMLLTPSVSVNYNDHFSLQGGAVTYLNATGTAKQISPFVNLSADVLRFTNAPVSYSWKVFASYSNAGNYYDYDSYFAYYSYNTGNHFLTPGFATPNTFAFPSAITDHSFNNYQAGSVLSFMNNRLSLSYNYEQRHFVTFVETYTSGGFSGFEYPLVGTKLNRLAITANVINNDQLKWFTTINGTQINYQYSFTNYPIGVFLYTPPTGTNEWTGGWINQFEFGNLSFGADVLYLVNSHFGNFNGVTAYTTNAANSFVLQNAYLSYRLKTKIFKTLNVYANTRNLAQNAASDITDNRKFWGLGFKAGF